MQVDPTIFRAYDIRGIMGQNLDDKVSELVGRAFGSWLVVNSKTAKPRVVVGRDNRFGSDKMGVKLVEGLLACGCQVTDIGLAITPLVHFATINYSSDAGIMVTASHNPKEFNGFRFDLANAIPFYGPQITALKELIEAEKFVTGIGSVTYKEDTFKDYIIDIKSRIKIKKKLKVVIDCGNGASSKFATDLFTQLGLEVEGLFCNLDGDFPYHSPDPEMRINLEDLRHKVVAEKADVGFAFDTDADRFGVADENGNTYENDKIMILLARDVLKNHPGSKVLCDIKSSYVLINEIKKLGGEPLMIKTGHPYFRIYLKDHDDVFLGGELSSHTFIKDNYYGFDDGPYAAARISQILSQTSQTLSQLLADIPHTAHTEEIKINCSDQEKLDIVNSLGSKLFKQGYSISDVDGYRVNVSPTSWFLIRSSNTGPYISLRFEAENKEKLLSLVALAKNNLSVYNNLDLDALGDGILEKAHNV